MVGQTSCHYQGEADLATLFEEVAPPLGVNLGRAMRAGDTLNVLPTTRDLYLSLSRPFRWDNRLDAIQAGKAWTGAEAF